MRITENNGHRGTTEFHADKPFIIRPVITGSEEIDGVLYYIGETGKRFIASLFDKMFSAPRLKVMAKNYKGKRIGKYYATQP